MFCRICGKELSDSVKFCPACGEKVKVRVKAKGGESFAADEIINSN